MPAVQDSLGRTYLVSDAVANAYASGVATLGNAWGDSYLRSSGTVDAQRQDEQSLTGRLNTLSPPPHWLDEYIADKVPRRTKKVVEEPMEKLTTPVIPEVTEDGVKRLYKTRYNELEQKYVELHSRYGKLQKSYTMLQNDLDQLSDELRKQEQEVKRLTLISADGVALDKRIDHVCKEAQIPLPNPTFRVQQTLEQKLDAFFGAILCRLRIEEPVDELAD